jgi:hypothetical protein
VWTAPTRQAERAIQEERQFNIDMRDNQGVLGSIIAQGEATTARKLMPLGDGEMVRVLCRVKMIGAQGSMLRLGSDVDP